jgi:hypothetical protein
MPSKGILCDLKGIQMNKCVKCGHTKLRTISRWWDCLPIYCSGCYVDLRRTTHYWIFHRINLCCSCYLSRIKFKISIKEIGDEL